MEWESDHACCHERTQRQTSTFGQISLAAPHARRLLLIVLTHAELLMMCTLPFVRKAGWSSDSSNLEGTYVRSLISSHPPDPGPAVWLATKPNHPRGSACVDWRLSFGCSISMHAQPACVYLLLLLHEWYTKLQHCCVYMSYPDRLTLWSKSN